MGSKKLKAVVVTGKENIRYQDHDEFSRLAKELMADLRDHPNAKRRYELGQ
jgi:aldehyde:ferredoxin oxidoreductase